LRKLKYFNSKIIICLSSFFIIVHFSDLFFPYSIFILNYLAFKNLFRLPVQNSIELAVWVFYWCFLAKKFSHSSIINNHWEIFTNLLLNLFIRNIQSLISEKNFKIACEVAICQRRAPISIYIIVIQPRAHEFPFWNIIHLFWKSNHFIYVLFRENSFAMYFLLLCSLKILLLSKLAFSISTFFSKS